MNSKIDKISSLAAAAFMAAAFLYYSRQDTEYTNTNHSGKRAYDNSIINPIQVGTIGIFTFPGSRGPNYIPASDIDMIRDIEDDYWEIEKLGNYYYKVRREDYEDIEGNCDEREELIGTYEDLYSYWLSHP